MRSLEPFRWLLVKEWRELLTARAWWLLLMGIGPLTGLSFIGAVRTYAEVSGVDGGGETLSPLVGIWAPTFSACELAAVFLLPFVAIRTIGADRQSGALKLELQRSRISPFARTGAKAAIALAGWLLAMLPAAIAILLWKSYGGSIHARELASVTAGHILNAGLTIALGFAAAAITEHPSTAAIVTLSVTVGTWILNFFAAIQGGLWERAAAFTPSAITGDFQHGLIRLDTVLIGSLLIAMGLGLAAIWQRLGVQPSRRIIESAALAGIAGAAMFACSYARASWDVSENRANSFPLADEIALRGLQAPLEIEVHLAPEDPRRADLERRAFSKLRRIVPALEIRYQSSTSTGLFEQTREGYGEIWYRVAGKKSMSRITTAEGVLEAIYETAGIQPPKDVTEPVFRGHPLVAKPAGAAAIFYGLWPGSILLCSILVRRKFQI